MKKLQEILGRVDELKWSGPAGSDDSTYTLTLDSAGRWWVQVYEDRGTWYVKTSFLYPNGMKLKAKDSKNAMPEAVGHLLKDINDILGGLKKV